MEKLVGLIPFQMALQQTQAGMSSGEAIFSVKDSVAMYGIMAFYTLAYETIRSDKTMELTTEVHCGILLRFYPMIMN